MRRTRDVPEMNPRCTRDVPQLYSRDVPEMDPRCTAAATQDELPLPLRSAYLAVLDEGYLNTEKGERDLAEI